MTVWIVGGDSMIGAALALRLAGDGGTPLASTRRLEPVSAGSRFLDLARDIDHVAVPAGCRAAVICAAATSQQFCRENPALSHRINVESPQTLATKLAEAGVFTIFLSTGAVLGGDHPNMPADAPYRPAGLYAAQKAEAEQRIRAALPMDRCAILRLPKVFCGKEPLLQGWFRDLGQHRKIAPFIDVCIAPVMIEDALAVILALLARQAAGTFQLSSADEISYAGLAQLLAGHWRFDARLIEPSLGRELNQTMKLSGMHASLDMTSTRRSLAIEPPDAADMTHALARAIIATRADHG
jgi:dTDP-4-dehydrorhamnose reductase